MANLPHDDQSAGVVVFGRKEWMAISYQDLADGVGVHVAV